MNTVNPPAARVNYEEYIRSPAWQIKREGALVRAGRKCQLCCSRKHLEVHHNNYANLGNEKDEDLFVMCELCHDVFHKHRDPRTAKRKNKTRGRGRGQRNIRSFEDIELNEIKTEWAKLPTRDNRQALADKHNCSRSLINDIVQGLKVYSVGYIPSPPSSNF